jgi:predicted transcriptional regulator
LVLSRLREAPEPLTGRQVWASCTVDGASHGPARTTVLTVLARLEHKGVIRRLDGDPVRFEAVRAESEAVAAQMQTLLERASDRHAVLLQFAGLLDAEDLAALAQDPGEVR